MKQETPSAGADVRRPDVRGKLVDVTTELVFSKDGLGLDRQQGDPLALAIAANAVGAFNEHFYDLVMPGFAERGLVAAYRPLEEAAASIADEPEIVEALASVWFASRASDGDRRPVDVGVDDADLGVRRAGAVPCPGAERLEFERIVAAFDLRCGAIVASGPPMSHLFIGHLGSLNRPVERIFAGLPYDQERFCALFEEFAKSVHVLHRAGCFHDRRGDAEGVTHRGLALARTLARSFAETTPPLAQSSNAEILLAIISWNVRMAAFYREFGPSYVQHALYETSPYVALAEDA